MEKIEKKKENVSKENRNGIKGGFFSSSKQFFQCLRRPQFGLQPFCTQIKGKNEAV